MVYKDFQAKKKSKKKANVNLLISLFSVWHYYKWNTFWTVDCYCDLGLWDKGINEENNEQIVLSYHSMCNVKWSSQG